MFLPLFLCFPLLVMFCFPCFMLFVGCLMLVDSSFSSLLWVIVSSNVLELQFQNSIFKLVVIWECVLFYNSFIFLGKNGHSCGHAFCRSYIKLVLGASMGVLTCRASDHACISTVQLALARSCLIFWVL